MRSIDILFLNKSIKFLELNYEGLFKELVKVLVYLLVLDKFELNFL